MEIRIKARRTKWYQALYIAETTIGGETLSAHGMSEAEAIGNLIRTHCIGLGVDLSITSNPNNGQARASA